MASFSSDAVELADAAAAAAHDPTSHAAKLKELLGQKDPSAAVIAEALAYSALTSIDFRNQNVQMTLDAFLQLKLTKEHVAAQEKMSRSAGLLAAASVFLAIVSLIGSCSGIS